MAAILPLLVLSVDAVTDLHRPRGHEARDDARNRAFVDDADGSVLYESNARHSRAIAIIARRAAGATPVMCTKPCPSDGNLNVRTRTPASARTPPYASPSSRKGSKPAITSSVGGRPARFGERRGDTRGSSRHTPVQPRYASRNASRSPRDR